MPPSDFLLQPLMAEAAAMDIFFRSSTVVLLFCVLPITLLLCFSPAVTNMLHIMEEADRRKHRWFCLHGGGVKYVLRGSICPAIFLTNPIGEIMNLLRQWKRQRPIRIYFLLKPNSWFHHGVETMNRLSQWKRQWKTVFVRQKYDWPREAVRFGEVSISIYSLKNKGFEIRLRKGSLKLT